MNYSGAKAILWKGTISGNKTNTTDWGGGGIFCSEGGYLMMPNPTAIYQNHAQGLGGGLASCSTGLIALDSSLNIFDNGYYKQQNLSRPKYETTGSKQYTSVYLNDGILADSAKDVYAANAITISGQMSTGANNKWTGDLDSNKITNSTDEELNAGFLLGLTNGSTSDQQTVAKNNSQLIITDNWSSTHGGGVLVNGLLVSGRVREEVIGHSFSLESTKRLIGSNSENINLQDNQFSFTVTDKDNNTVGLGLSKSDGSIVFDKTIPVNKVENGQAIFYLKENPSQIASADSDPSKYRIELKVNTDNYSYNYKDPETSEIILVQVIKYTIKQDASGKPIGAVYKDSGNGSWTLFSDCTFSSGTGNSGGHLKIGNSSFAFTNKKITEREISVQKSWDGDAEHPAIQVYLKRALEGTNRNNPETVQINGKDNPATLSSLKGWSYDWGSVATADSNGKDYEYWVEEVIPESFRNLYEVSIESETDTLTIDTTPTTRNVEAWIPVTENPFDRPRQGQYALISDNGYLLSVNNESITPKQLQKIKFDDNSEGYEITENEDDFTFYPSNFNFSENQGSQAIRLCSDNKWLSLQNSILKITDSKDHYDHGSHVYVQTGGEPLLARNRNNPVIEPYYPVSYENGYFGINGDKPNDPVRFYKKETKQITTSGTPTKYTLTFKVKNTLKTQYSLQVQKVSSTDRKPLGSARFQLYRNSSESEPLKFKRDNQDRYVLDLDGSETEIATNVEGLITFINLPKGTYILKEIEPPQGYAILNEEYTIYLTPNNEQFDNNTLSLNVEVQNTPIPYELPETGGSGTKIYTAVGTILFLAGTSMYGYKRRQQRKGGKTH
ncbi:Cna B-type domain-containing protein [Erysipelotrichaceae bacterium RD49]|nr:Cna B-type domain-containing protein [Erysipelotrichaceae bacterium RD49]